MGTFLRRRGWRRQGTRPPPALSQFWRQRCEARTIGCNVMIRIEKNAIGVVCLFWPPPACLNPGLLRWGLDGLGFVGVKATASVAALHRHPATARQRFRLLTGLRQVSACQRPRAPGVRPRARIRETPAGAASCPGVPAGLPRSPVARARHDPRRQNRGAWLGSLLCRVIDASGCSSLERSRSHAEGPGDLRVSRSARRTEPAPAYSIGEQLTRPGCFRPVGNGSGGAKPRPGDRTPGSGP